MIKAYSNKNQFEQETVNLITKQISESFGNGAEKFYMGLCGGSTPKSIYKILSTNETKRIYDSKMEFYVIDERQVEFDSIYSNYKMIKETLFNNQIENNNLNDFDCNLLNKKSSEYILKKYEDKLLEIPKLQLDLCLVGVGDDGHFASVFPGSDLFESNLLVAQTKTQLFDVDNRFTISPGIIKKSKKIIILMSGEKKQKVFNKIVAFKKFEKDFPISYLLDHTNIDIYYSQV